MFNRLTIRPPVVVNRAVASPILCSPVSLPQISSTVPLPPPGLALKQTSVSFALAQEAMPDLMPQISLPPLWREIPKWPPTFGFFKRPPSKNNGRCPLLRTSHVCFLTSIRVRRALPRTRWSMGRSLLGVAWPCVVTGKVTLDRASLVTRMTPPNGTWFTEKNITPLGVQNCSTNDPLDLSLKLSSDRLLFKTPRFNVRLLNSKPLNLLKTSLEGSLLHEPTLLRTILILPLTLRLGNRERNIRLDSSLKVSWKRLLTKTEQMKALLPAAQVPSLFFIPLT